MPNLGIFVCNRCYGIFREVGAHVARPKCIGLDSWSEEEAVRLEALGNTAANAYWEKAYCPESSRVLKPTPASSTGDARKWIKVRGFFRDSRAAHSGAGELTPRRPRRARRPSTRASASSPRAPRGPRRSRRGRRCREAPPAV